jgi:hypothetical protein
MLGWRDIGMDSNGLTSIPSFVKISEVVRKLEGGLRQHNDIRFHFLPLRMENRLKETKMNEEQTKLFVN